jgi:hypothetical protein
MQEEDFEEVEENLDRDESDTEEQKEDLDDMLDRLTGGDDL